MVILGIDPGTATTGYGLIRYNLGKYELVDFGLIETDKNGDPGKRLINIHDQLKKILLEYKPNVIAIEKLFFASNAKTAMRVGQAHGVLLFCAAQHKMEVYEYAPAFIKKIITGDGRADKKLIQKSLRKIFGAKVRSRKHKKTHFDNAADALAVAVTHAISYSNK